MSRQALRDAAAAAGISEDQAEMFVRQLIHPTRQQCAQADQHGADEMPPFSWPSYWQEETVEALKKEGWADLTNGEYRYTKYARVWRLMCAALLLDEPRWTWASEKWPHPRGDFDGERIKGAMSSPFDDL